MSYIITTDRAELEAYQTECDKELGFPEPLEKFKHVGIGIHCDFNVGRAFHYAEIKEDDLKVEAMIPVATQATKTAIPEKVTVVDTLPEKWVAVAVLA